jgi:hypothetical protein
MREASAMPPTLRLDPSKQKIVAIHSGVLILAKLRS